MSVTTGGTRPGMWGLSDDGRDKWMEYQQRMLGNSITAISQDVPTSLETRVTDIYGRTHSSATRALVARGYTVHLGPLRREVRRARWRPSEPALWLMYTAACFAIGALL